MSTHLYSILRSFFDDALIDHLVEQSNLYSVQSTGNSIAVDHDEMEMYLGLLVMMSIVKLPQLRMYWSKETRIPSVADVMPVNRFEKIKQFFHCYDNTKNLPSTDKDYDKLFKVRPVIESLKEKCTQIPQEEFHSVDEQIIPTKSHTSLRQYLPNKPNKWGINNYSVSIGRVLAIVFSQKLKPFYSYQVQGKLTFIKNVHIP